jgi:ferredoxin
MSRWLVVADETTCIGAGVCAGVGPNYFSLANGKTRPTAAEVDADDEVIDAADCCPMGAIRVIEKATGAVLAPVDQ